MGTKDFTPPEPEFPDEEFSAPASPSVPHSREAEEAVIGSILINQEVYYEVVEILKAEDFYIHRNKWTFEAIEKLASRKDVIDLLTISEQLDADGMLAEVGGSAYLTSLINQVPSSLNALSYAYIIEGHSVRRKMVNRANEIAKIAYNEAKPIDTALQEYDTLVESRLMTSTRDDTQDSDEASLDLIEKIQNKTPTGVLSHLPEFDKPEALGGFPVGGTLLLGDSSFGKSALTLQICEQVALFGEVALYIGPESTNEQMVIRRVSGLSGVDYANKKIRTASLTQTEEEALVNAITNDYQGKFGGRLKFNSKATTLQAVERAIRIHRPKICVIDQISQITDMPTSNATLNLLHNFTKLKAIGNRYGCAMVIVHAISPDESRQFFKKNQKANSKTNGQPQKNVRPDINAIPWASQMKFLADVILFLVPEVNQNIVHASILEILVWILKDRDGSRFVDTWFDYDLKKQWFTDKPSPFVQSAQRPTGKTKMVDYNPPEPEDPFSPQDLLFPEE